MNCTKEMLLLYAVTDRTWTTSQTLYQQVESAIKGGVTCVQLREKDLSEDLFLKEALEIKTLCNAYHIPFIINDNVEIALACHADGIHVGQTDMDFEKVRSIIGHHKILGVSVQTIEQAILAQKLGADYLGVGAVFSTSTKQDATPVSYETLKAICNAVSIPVVAIGGICKQNLLQLTGSGIDGVALISAIFASKDIQTECIQLKELAYTMVHTTRKE